MKLPIDNSKRAITAIVVLFFFLPSFSQFFECPLEQAALLTGSAEYNNLLKDELYNDLKTNAAQTSIDLEFNQMKTWQAKYNDYLSTASGFASSLKACSTLYDEGVRTFISLCDLKKSVEKNPSGVFSTAMLNDIFLETGSELVSIYTTLENAIAKGGEENMLTGSERNQLLWELDDRMKNLNKKLRLLSMSVRMYTLTDVWHEATTGIVERSTAEIANYSLQRWAKAAGATGSIIK